MSGHACVQMPPDYQTFKRAQRIPTAPAAQVDLFAVAADDEAGEAGEAGEDETP